MLFWRSQGLPESEPTLRKKQEHRNYFLDFPLKYITSIRSNILTLGILKKQCSYSYNYMTQTIWQRSVGPT